MPLQHSLEVFMRYAVTIAIALVASACVDAQDVPKIARDLSTAKEEYFEAVSDAESSFVQLLDRTIESARLRGDLEKVERLTVQRTEFSRNGTLPKDRRATSYERSVKSARSKLLRGYGEAVREYTKANLISEARSVREEMKALADSRTIRQQRQRVKITRLLAECKDAANDARESLLQEIDQRVSQVNKSRSIDTERKKQLTALLTEERVAFEKNGMVPFSINLRDVTLGYMTRLQEAKVPLISAFDTAIKHAKDRQDDELVTNLEQEKVKALRPHEIAKWQCTGTNFRLNMTLTLYSNFTGEPATPHRIWKMTPKGIEMRFTNVVENCTISEDGKSFEAKGSKAHRKAHRYRGVRIDSNSEILKVD